MLAARFGQRRGQRGIQAKRCAFDALRLYAPLSATLAEPRREHIRQLLSWAARLHEIGISIAYSGYHKHSAYIAQNADMPGFSKADQTSLALLAGAHRGSLNKVRAMVTDEDEWAPILALRLAVILNRRRVNREDPPLTLAQQDGSFRVAVDNEWLDQHPLSATALDNEVAQWQAIGLKVRIDRLV